MNTSRAGEVFAVVEELTTATTALLDEDLTHYTDTDFVELMRRVEAVRARLGAVSHRLVIETSDRHLPERAGCKSLAKYLSETLRISMAEAGARRRAAQKLGVFHFVHGEDREPEYPRTAAHQTAGRLSIEHARRIMAVMDRIPAAVPTELRVEAERLLAEHACTMTPEAVVTVGESILAHLDPDGTLTDDRDRDRVRRITVGRQRIDGMTEISGLLTPHLRALLDAVLAKGSRPGMCNPADPDSPTLGARAIDPKTLEAAAERDTRTIAQRNHDAVAAFLTATGGSKTLGSHRGCPSRSCSPCASRTSNAAPGTRSPPRARPCRSRPRCGWPQAATRGCCSSAATASPSTSGADNASRRAGSGWRVWPATVAVPSLVVTRPRRCARCTI
nr:MULTISPECIES: DUF222 domain-containing protein [unclassified Nocardia]